MSEPNDYNAQVVEEFRTNGGKVGGPFEGFPLVLVHHTGAKSGTERVNPLVYQRLGDDSVAIFASKGGAPTNPDWYYNLVANPNTTIEIGTDRYDVTARVDALGHTDGHVRERHPAIWGQRPVVPGSRNASPRPRRL